ncbi:hypothetical protein GYO_3652 [Bacillus spizizenii TU-B-10]|uniref:Uncharacterized protein n=1 Tax=Bacillus spizizenii (strain DSM 15029 / JCM 12233 / NBRC 101239 / NRRL B-23049 / TU-B-10) TaxID=1052585 RepID=G4P0P9_BACS4|nr:hypothetical protein GYO_3652 [Bacillus spizizenii TU-B-10]
MKRIRIPMTLALGAALTIALCPLLPLKKILLRRSHRQQLPEQLPLM